MGFAQEVVSETGSNPLTTFTTLLEQEQEKLQEPPPESNKDKRDRERRRSNEIPLEDQQCP